MIKKQKENKSKLARELGISRSLIYYQHKRPIIDEEIKTLIEGVLEVHKDYGHKRIAWELKLNHKRINRVMKKFGIKPYRRKAKFKVKKADLNKPPTQFTNLIQDLIIDHPNQVWCTDFTYIKYQTRFIYLATIIDRFTREIVGFSLSRYHNRFLVISALLEALDTGVKPEIIHSDQGSEYDSGDFNRFETTGELVEEIYHQIHYYNHSRIHRSLKTNPCQFKVNYLSNKATESLS